jgi:hypothetical protein
MEVRNERSECRQEKAVMTRVQRGKENPTRRAAYSGRAAMRDFPVAVFLLRPSRIMRGEYAALYGTHGFHKLAA